VDNRTGFRRTGHAFLAEEARKALGITGEIHSLAEVPVPLVHTGFGAAVCAAAVVVRPEILGFRNSAIADAALAVLTVIVLAGYDLLVYPRERRPGIEGLALPVAAVGAFSAVLATNPPFAVKMAAGVIAALVIGGVPQLALRRATAAEGGTTRLLRDMAGVAVLAPVMVASAMSSLDPRWRFGLVGAITALVSYDALRTEGLAAGRVAVASLGLGAAMAAAAALITPTSAQLGVRAAMLLVLWYGLRGIAAALVGRSARRVLAVLEYGAFVALAIGALRWMGP